MMTLPPSLLARFEVLRRLGEGSFGEVLEVRDRDTGARRALKVVQVQGEGERERREIAASMRVRHPHLVRCYEGEVLGDRAFLILDLAGGTLEDRIRDPERRAECWELLRQACRGVAALHRHGLVHRDLKPSNVLLGPRGALVSDLGLAKGADLETVTKTGMIMGTPGYLPPEQARGQPAAPPGDVFALGVMLYEVVEGRLPYPEGPPLEMLRTVARGDVDDLHVAVEVLDPPVVARLRGMLSVDPAARPSDLEEVAEDLGPWPERTVRLPVSRDQALAEQAAQGGDVSRANTLLSGLASLEEPRPTGARVLPGRGAWAAGAGALLALGLGSVALLGDGPPTDVRWTTVGDVVVVEFASDAPREVRMELGGERSGSPDPLGEGRYRIAMRFPPGDPEAVARLHWDGGAGSPVRMTPERPAVLPDIRLAAGRRLRLEVLRACAVHWAGDTDRVHRLEPGRRRIPPPREAEGPWTLYWREEGIESSREVHPADLFEQAIERLDEGVGGVNVPAVLEERLTQRFLLAVDREVDERHWGDDPLEAELDVWAELLEWIPEMLASEASVAGRLRLAELWDAWQVAFHVERDLTMAADRYPDLGFRPGARREALPNWPGARVEELPFGPPDAGELDRQPKELATATRMNLAAFMAGGSRYDPTAPKVLRFRWPEGASGGGGRVAVSLRATMSLWFAFELRAAADPRWVVTLRHESLRMPAFPREELEAAATQEERMEIRHRHRRRWLRSDLTWLTGVLPADLSPPPGSWVEIRLEPILSNWPSGGAVDQVRVSVEHPGEEAHGG